MGAGGARPAGAVVGRVVDPGGAVLSPPGRRNGLGRSGLADRAPPRTEMIFSTSGGAGSGASGAAAAVSGGPNSDWNSMYPPPPSAPIVSSHARAGTTGDGLPGCVFTSSGDSGRARSPAGRGAYAAGLSEVNLSMGTAACPCRE
jgi:hypothetical protein